MSLWSSLQIVLMPAKKATNEYVWKFNMTLYCAKRSPREGTSVLVEFTKLKLMLMKSEPDDIVQFDQRCKEGMVRAG